MDIKSRIITYGELRHGFNVSNDKFGIASFQKEERRRAFLANPSGVDDDSPYIFLALDGDIPVGRNMYFKSRLKVGNTVLPVYCGTGFEVAEEYRKEGIGGQIFWEGYRRKERNPLLSAAISDDAIPLSRKLKYTIFEFPRMMLLINARPILVRYRLKGICLSVCCGVVNFLLRCYYSIVRIKRKKKYKDLEIKKLSTVPAWVDDIVMNDGHKYAEVHDQKWFQWNIENRFTSNTRDCQSFFAIYKDDKPEAFFVTKERYRDDAGGLKDVVVASFVEWGIKKGSVLNEGDLLYLAERLLPNDVDIFQTASSDETTLKLLRKFGYKHHGDNRIIFKDKEKTMTDASDISLWRLRYGYTDVILF